MSSYKLVLVCFLMSAAFLRISQAVQAVYYPDPPVENRVTIQRVNNMSPSMQLDASDFLKQAYSRTNNPGERCGILRQLFSEKYLEHSWHVVLYKAYSIQYAKSIELKVNDDYYLLFATKK